MHGAIALALLASDLDAEARAQQFAARAFARDAARGAVPIDWSGGDLAVDPTVIFHFHPGLGRTIQQIERQGLLMLQHRHEPAFNLAPEDFCLELAWDHKWALGNGANTSFVHRIVDERPPIEGIVADPIRQVEALQSTQSIPHPRIPLASNPCGPELNSAGLDLTECAELIRLAQDSRTAIDAQ